MSMQIHLGITSIFRYPSPVHGMSVYLGNLYFLIVMWYKSLVGLMYLLLFQFLILYSSSIKWKCLINSVSAICGLQIEVHLIFKKILVSSCLAKFTEFIRFSVIISSTFFLSLFHSSIFWMSVTHLKTYWSVWQVFEDLLIFFICFFY